MATKEEICSGAFILVGASAITSFSDGSTEATVAASLYDDTVNAAIAAFPWPWCTQDADVGSQLADPPPTTWTYAYSFPASPAVLEPLALFYNDVPIEFDVRDGIIYCDELNAGDGVGPIFRYLYRPVEAHFRPLFIAALKLELASQFAFAFDRAERGTALSELAAASAWPKARRSASQGVTANRLEATALRSARN